MTAVRNAEWRAETASKLQERLPLILAPIQNHRQAAVREALAEGVKLLMRALSLSSNTLEDCVLIL